MTSLLDRPRLVTEGARPEDGVPDMTIISEIDEYGINTNLKTRYNHDKIYTYSGTILVAVNPYKTLNIYESDYIDAYTGKIMTDMPPHVFAVAESALRYFRTDRKNQSCIISGESGAGKTETTKFILQYLCAVTYSESRWAEQQILEANTVLESFGNAKTLRNDNSSRFGKFIQVCFDSRGQISGCIIQDYLLELSRISFQSTGERNYHVFYQMIAGAMTNRELKEELLLEPATSFHYLNQSGCTTLENVDDLKMYNDLCLALQVLQVPPDLVTGIFQVLSAILWIGNLQFEDTDAETCRLSKTDQVTVKKIAHLLGLNESVVSKICTSREIHVKGSVTNITLKYKEAQENRHAMSKALYSRTFTWLVQQINSCNNPGTDSSRFIGVLDIFGFEKFECNSFEQLCINYTNEKLHKFFNHYVFALEQQVYKEEGIKFSHITFTDNTVCLELIDKAPKCVLRLLDEECRFPKGTDESYLNKLHHEVSKHPNFIKGEDKRRWGIEFGIKHYAGPVVYSIEGFLDKNKDVQQEMFFDAMESSKSPFVLEIVKYRDMLTTYLEMAKSRTTSSRSLVSGTKTSKGKPTVGDTFRTQLLALVDTLDATTPWYVRCLKPNDSKSPKLYDNELIISQLRYSGMLDIVRIRKEGYPVHVPAREFMEKYRCLAQNDPNPLPGDDKKAVEYILKSLKVPETEWQIGKTKIFLRNSVFDPLERERKKLLTAKMIIIQKVWRGYRIRKRFLIAKSAAITIQKYFRGRRERILYIRKKRSAILIQAHVRAFFARLIVEELRQKKLEEKKRLERLRREEEEKRRKEEEQKLIHEEEKAKEEAFKAAQKELYTLAQMANKKAEKTVDKKGQVNLDEMFVFLKEDPKPRGDDEKVFLRSLSQDLESMFQHSEGAKLPMSPIKETPKPPVLSFETKENTRAQRRRQRDRRVFKKLLGVEDEENPYREDSFDPSAYPLTKFAEMYFNDFPKDTTGFSTFSLRRMPSKIKDALPKAEMLTYTKNSSLPTSMIHMHLPENVNLACSIFKDLCRLLRGDTKDEQTSLIIQSCIAYGIDRSELRDEIFCQVIRQVTDNPNEEAIVRGWHFLTLATIAFPPSKNFNKYLQAFYVVKSSDPLIGKYAATCLQTIRQMKPSPRRLPPSSIEIEAVKVPSKLICRFYFLDGKAKAMAVDPCATASDVVRDLASRVDLQSGDGWALFEVNPDHEHFIKGFEYISDILSQWERDKRSSMRMTQYTTISKRPSYTAALGGGDSRFVFRKRIFRKPKEIPDDPVEYHLMYAQAVHAVTKLDAFPINEKVALQLAGLHSQVLWGSHDGGSMSRYNELEQYIHPRILSSNKTKTRDDWKKSISEAHELFGTGKTELQAKVWYLTAVKHYPLYGYSQYYVTYKGFWSHPNSIILAVGAEGVKFVNQKTKHVMAEYEYGELENITVNILEDAVTLNMKAKPSEHQKQVSFNFETRPGHKEDIANLIASYSPSHQNWQRVGETKTNVVKVSEEDRSKIWSDISVLRKSLVEHGILRKPPDQQTGFLTTTLRRYVNKQRLEQLSSQVGTAGKDYDKVYKRSYWSYSKTMLRQPLTISLGEEEDEMCLQLFYTVLLHAGITPSSGKGFENVHPDDVMTLVQVALEKCLQKEALCNEFYLQLIKQTTEQPDSNSRINIQNWRFLCLACGVVVPRNKPILHYLQAHLRRCSLDSHTEEGQYAQFCIKCMNRTIDGKNKKYPPSQREIHCIIRRCLIHERFYFTDGQFRALEFDSAATAEEVVQLVQDRIGLRSDAVGFSLYEVLGQLERNMLPTDKVSDAMFKWEKYSKSTGSNKTLKLTFKKRLFIRPFYNPEDPVEFSLLLHQVIDDIANDRFPISLSEIVYIAGLRAQATLGNYQDTIEFSDYVSIVEQVIPHHLKQRVHPDDIRRKHYEYSDLSEQECNEALFEFVQQWPLYGSTIFEVVQAHTTTLPKNLWLAVNQFGIHILKRRDKEPLVSYEYKSIVNYSPSLKSLLIVMDSLTKGTRFIFNTTQASQIAHLIRDYTHLVAERQRKSFNRVSYTLI